MHHRHNADRNKKFSRGDLTPRLKLFQNGASVSAHLSHKLARRTSFHSRFKLLPEHNHGLGGCPQGYIFATIVCFGNFASANLDVFQHRTLKRKDGTLLGANCSLRQQMPRHFRCIRLSETYGNLQ
ncbi:hypothetical protein AGR13a_Cc240036 [Agrobacterium genomosp. 13 str. CFBP 6927]|uniref:Uncharacterized protein n=1 Tax=Agrobacterium genomosp. 13 str. CFBP 6927 TaxID=1183428 RepID=A0ABM9VEA2_9HYPH|nr:hypothetical protein AGR13a_Cc240036 [Agrobacterium genomosp. 13 str. CFBP 6927]